MSQLGESSVVPAPLKKLQDVLDYVKRTDFGKLKSEFSTILTNSDYESDFDFNRSWPIIMEKSRIVALNFSSINIYDAGQISRINIINSKFHEILDIQSSPDGYTFDSLNLKLILIRLSFEDLASILPKSHSNHFNYF